MRAIFIVTGLALLKYFHWIIYVFGALLIFTGGKMLTQREASIHPERNPVLRLLRRYMPITERYEGQRFFVLRQGRRFATPLLVVLAMIESTDVLAVTRDPFIVYTSNVFAILGLRALYFLLAGVMDLFHYLRYGLGVVLVFVGVKMILADLYKIPITTSLAVIGVILTVSVVASVMRNRLLARLPVPARDVTRSE